MHEVFCQSFKFSIETKVDKVIWICKSGQIWKGKTHVNITRDKIKGKDCSSCLSRDTWINFDACPKISKY